jgi:hypothetical protein
MANEGRAEPSDSGWDEQQKAITRPRSDLQGEGAHAAARREAVIAPFVGLSR